VAAVLLSPEGSSGGAAVFPPSVGGDEESRPPGPSSEEGVGAVLCPLTGAEQEVAKSLCWSVERSLMLHGPFL